MIDSSTHCSCRSLYQEGCLLPGGLVLQAFPQKVLPVTLFPPGQAGVVFVSASSWAPLCCSADDTRFSTVRLVFLSVGSRDCAGFVLAVSELLHTVGAQQMLVGEGKDPGSKKGGW